MGVLRASLCALLFAVLTGPVWPVAAETNGSKRPRDPVLVSADRARKHYEWLHAHPELSGQEAKTAAHLGREVRKLGFSVRERIGGYGLVAVLKNGEGMALMVRTELDALPVLEQTKLPYASRVKARLPDGEEAPVMHACGHDLHMAAWLGAAEFFATHRSLWRGTLIFVAQPAEETLSGARAMIDAAFLRGLPRPDLAFAVHVHDQLPVGALGWTEGPFAASADSISIVMHGKGGHGAYPEATVDPIVMAAQLVIDLQTIISREVSPLVPAVLTVGSIHGGTKNNVIPSDVRLELTLRTYSEQARAQILKAIERVANAAAQGMNAPRAPTIEVRPGAGVAINDPKMTQELALHLKETGQFELVPLGREMGSEDFAEYGKAGLPTVMLMVGTVQQVTGPATQTTGINPSATHSSTYAPDMPGSLEAAIRVHTEVGLFVLHR